MVKDPVPLEMRDKTIAGDCTKDGMLVAEKNCKGCHIIEGVGRRYSADHQGTGAISAESATEGSKTQPLWLHPFLKDPGTVRLRPWLNARMPTFHLTEQQNATIGRYFSALDKVDFPFIIDRLSTRMLKASRRRRAIHEAAMRKLPSDRARALPPGKDPADLAPNLALAQRTFASGVGIAVADRSPEDCVRAPECRPSSPMVKALCRIFLVAMRRPRSRPFETTCSSQWVVAAGVIRFRRITESGACLKQKKIPLLDSEGTATHRAGEVNEDQAENMLVVDRSRSALGPPLLISEGIFVGVISNRSHRRISPSLVFEITF